VADSFLGRFGVLYQGLCASSIILTGHTQGCSVPTQQFEMLPLLFAGVLAGTLQSTKFPPLLNAVPRAGLVVTQYDLTADPTCMHAGFWSYHGGGPYHGVPIMNFAGWARVALASIGIDSAADLLGVADTAGNGGNMLLPLARSPATGGLFVAAIEQERVGSGAPACPAGISHQVRLHS
jgi:hypothetical protein